jgi:hypothetical protein
MNGLFTLLSLEQELQGQLQSPRIRPLIVGIGRSQALVDVAGIHQPRAFRSHVIDLRHSGFNKVTLNAEIPLLDIGRAQVPLERSGRSGIGKRKIVGKRI